MQVIDYRQVGAAQATAMSVFLPLRDNKFPLSEADFIRRSKVAPQYFQHLSLLSLALGQKFPSSVTASGKKFSPLSLCDVLRYNG